MRVRTRLLLILSVASWLPVVSSHLIRVSVTPWSGCVENQEVKQLTRNVTVCYDNLSTSIRDSCEVFSPQHNPREAFWVSRSCPESDTHHQRPVVALIFCSVLISCLIGGCAWRAIGEGAVSVPAAGNTWVAPHHEDHKSGSFRVIPLPAVCTVHFH